MMRHIKVGGWQRGPVPTLSSALKICEQVTFENSQSFYFATLFLPSEQRQAIRALYAFCRWSDDLVDEPDGGVGHTIDTWSAHAYDEEPYGQDPVHLAWTYIRQRYQLSSEVIADLLAGVQMDLAVDRYHTFEELWLYCYRVASTVGLLSMQILGHAPGAEKYAIKLGVALQLTNILRDVGEDARRGRIYLPLNELAEFALKEEDILQGRHDERYLALMRFQIARAHRLYDEAWPGIGMLHKDGRFAVAAAAEVYRGILCAIEKNGYDNHTRRAYVPKWKKVVMLPRVWSRVKSLDSNPFLVIGRPTA